MVDEYLSEKEQIALIRHWWKENGRFVLTGLVLGILILVGWRYWQHHVTTRAESAASSYSALLEAVEAQNREEALDIGENLITTYEDTPYAVQAGFALARLHVELNELEDAASRLRWVMEHSDQEELEHIARLRLARVLVALARTDDALSLLERGDTGIFEPRYHELRGDVRLAMGDREAARADYELALDAAESGLVDREMLQMKLDDLISLSRPDATREGESSADAAPEE